MIKKASLVLIVVSLVVLGAAIGYGLSNKKCEQAKPDDYSLAFAKGEEAGKKATLTSGSYWHCVETSNSEAEGYLFCFSDKEQQTSLCNMAESEASANVGVALLGCPNGVFISDPAGPQL